MKFIALICESNKPNANNRIYPKDILAEQVDSLQDDVKQRRLMGELGQPSDATIHLDKVSHIITDLYMSDNLMMAEIEVLDTTNGKKLKELLSNGQVGFRMSGIGSGTMKYNQFIIDEFKLIQIFACENPA